jgi:hypothetical protein
MIRRRHLVRALSVVAVCLVVAGTLTGWALARRASYPRDTSAFQHYVATYVGGWSDSSDPTGPKRDEAWVAAHTDQVLAAGDRACSWLAARQNAPTVDPTGNTSFDSLMKAYVGVDFNSPAGLPYYAPGADIGVTLSPVGRTAVVAGAWAYLCRSTREAKTAPRSLEES